MMRYSEVARRYATALFDINSDVGVLEQIRGLNKLFSEDAEIADFINSPLIQPLDRAAALKAALEGSNINEDLKNFVLLLAEKNRLGIFSDIELAFQDKTDAANGVTRGIVRASHELSADEQSKLEEMIQKATGKKVILTYEKDPSVIGGLKAQVGSFTFDDTVDTHLRRMKEELNRSAH